MSSLPKRKYTPEEYLELERSAASKSEHFDGEIFAMTGASLRHNIIAANVIASLHSQLADQRCRVLTSNMRVLVEATGLFTYPDATVVRGEVRLADEQHKDTLLNPKVLIEVLSPLTPGYDRGEKFEHYRRIESLAEYVTIAQDRIHAEHSTRQERPAWPLSETDERGAVIHLASIGCTLRVDDIYMGTGVESDS